MDDLREVIAPDYEAIIEAASAKMRVNQRGVRGQMITPQDDFSWWVMQEAADAALAAIKQAGFVVVPAEPTARMCMAGANERDNGDGGLHRRKYRAMIEASNAPT